MSIVWVRKWNLDLTIFFLFFFRTLFSPCMNRIVVFFKDRHILLPLSKRKFPFPVAELQAQKRVTFFKTQKVSLEFKALLLIPLQILFQQLLSTFQSYHYQFSDPQRAIVCLLFDVFFLVLDHDDNHSQQKTNEETASRSQVPSAGINGAQSCCFPWSCCFR